MLTWSLEPIAATPAQAFLPVGAQPTREGVVYRVWAPDRETLRVVVGRPEFETRYIPLERDDEGYFTGRDEDGRAGDRYWFQLGDGEAPLVPDPASRFQPDGVAGPSEVIDPKVFEWRTRDWRRPPLRGRVIYELHIGAFTAEGTFRAAIGRLDALVDLGVNAIELMPIADFAGERNWGYDGVMLFAPAHSYGPPDDLRALVDAAHARGIAVILDVVYNHLGPCGNVLPAFSSHYFHPARESGWGRGLNFSGAHARPVRAFFLQNACRWLDEFRLDGLRLDAVHAMEDDSDPHLVAEIAAAAQARGAFVIAEDERNEARIVTSRDQPGGWGLDGMWADDFHHVVRVALTREQHAHFANYSGALDEWVDTLREGWYYHGQYFKGWKRPRGSSGLELPPERFVFCISNHDQVGNRPLGERLSDAVAPAAYRAVSMLLCLAPFTPMLFMGQEWAASTPFPFFTDHPGEVGEKIAENRMMEFRQRNAAYAPALLARMPNPQALATFESAKLKWAERERGPHAAMLALYRACLRLRAGHAIFQSPPRSAWAVERVGEALLGLRWHEGEGDWLLLVAVKSGPHPWHDGEFARVKPGRQWRLALASEDISFGGRGVSTPTSGEPASFVGPGAALWREESL